MHKTAHSVGHKVLLAVVYLEQNVVLNLALSMFQCL